MRYLICVAIIATFAIGGCGKKDNDKSKPAPVKVQPDKPVDPPKPDVVEPGDDIATEADFEEEATKEITAANIEDELKKIEDDLGE
jgi:hypothetical protein